MTVLNQFKITILIMLFYSVSITALIYAMPDDQVKEYALSYQDLNGQSIDIDDTAGDIDAGLQTLTNVPVVDLAALVFYSGNILLDLLLNFAFALPQMFIMLLNGFSMIFGGADAQVMIYLQTFLSVAMLALYFIGLIQLLTGIRSGRIV